MATVVPNVGSTRAPIPAASELRHLAARRAPLSRGRVAVLAPAAATIAILVADRLAVGCYVNPKLEFESLILYCLQVGDYLTMLVIYFYLTHLIAAMGHHWRHF